MTRRSIAILGLLAACTTDNSTAPAPPAPIVKSHPKRGYVINVPLPGSQPFGVAIARSGLVYVAQRGNGSLAVFQLPDTTLRGKVPAGSIPADIVLDSSGTTAYVSNAIDGYVQKIDVVSRTRRDSTNIGGSPNRLALSPDGARLFVTTTQGQLNILDAPSLVLLQRTSLVGQLDGIAVDTTGQVLYVASTLGGIYKLDARTGAIELSVTDSGTPQDVVLSPDGTRLYVANESGWVLVLDPVTLKPVQQFTVPAAYGLAISPDGAQLWVTQPNAYSMEILDAATGELVAARPSNAQPQRIAFDAIGTTAVVTNTADLVQFMQ